MIQKPLTVTVFIGIVAELGEGFGILLSSTCAVDATTGTNCWDVRIMAIKISRRSWAEVVCITILGLVDAKCEQSNILIL